MASIHTGHRQRVKEEFLTRGLEGMPDHRVLELLLFFAIPQGDVNPLAHALMDHFGSLSGVFHATYEELLKVKGVGPNTAALIRFIPAVGGRYLEDRISLTGQLTCAKEYLEVLAPYFFGARVEMSYLLCMDGKGKVITCRKMGEGTVAEVPLNARRVVEIALSANASKVVLAHNHVSGFAMPSTSDITTTAEIKRVLHSVGVTLTDHLIIVDGDMVSMAESHLL